MPRILSPMTPIFSNSDTTIVFNPLTAPMSPAGVQAVKFSAWLAPTSGLALGIQIQPAWQFSDDGVDWSATPVQVAMQAGKAWTNATDWTFGDDSTYIPVGASQSAASVRFGLAALSTSAGLPMQYAMAKLRVEAQREFPASIAVAPTRVFTFADTDFVALTPPIPANLVPHVRAELELSGVGGTSMTVQTAWQQADEPSVAADWTGLTTFGTARTADGLYPANLFTALAATKRFVRLGVQVTQASGTDVRSCVARARFDWR